MSNQPSSNTADQIHAAVREHYGAIARDRVTDEASTSCCASTTVVGAGESCCGDNSCGVSLYDPAMVEGLPVDVSQLSLGCGDPISIASLRPGETVVDLGSGGGIDCFLAAKRVGLMGKVIGVDMTPDMLAKANANKEKMGVRNVEFRQGQIEALPVDDSSVDVVMSNCVINLSPDKQAAFREAFRVLKPGGRVSISDIVTEGEFSVELRAKTDQWAACVTGAIDVDEYTGIMREVGFVNIEVVDKVKADEIVPTQAGMPRLFSARITGRKA